MKEDFKFQTNLSSAVALQSRTPKAKSKQECHLQGPLVKRLPSMSRDLESLFPICKASRPFPDQGNFVRVPNSSLHHNCQPHEQNRKSYQPYQKKSQHRTNCKS